MTEHQTGTKPRLGELVITVFMLAFFAAAFLLAGDFPYRAALFPRIVSVLGFGLSLLRLAGLIREAVRGRATPVPLPAVAVAPAASVEPPPSSAVGAGTGGESGETIPTTSELAIVDDDIEDDASMEYVFASAGGRAWLEAMSWIVTFFVAFFVLGAFVSVPLFAFFYLRFSGKASWLSAGIYAVVSGVLIYLMFRELVYIPLPTGVFPFLQF